MSAVPMPPRVLFQLPHLCFAYPEFSEQQDRGYAFKNKNYQKTVYCDFPGTPVVETSCFSSRGHRFDSRSGTEILQASRHDTPPPKKILHKVMAN